MILGVYAIGVFTHYLLVSARARQLNHRLKNRRNAIITRRENDATLHAQSRSSTDVWRDANNHGPVNGHGSSHASPSGFVAVNAHRPEGEHTEENNLSSQLLFSHSNTDNVTMINGKSIKGASPTTRADLMKKFFTTADRHARGYDDATTPVNPQSLPLPLPRSRAGAGAGAEVPDQTLFNPATASPVAIPSTPSSLLPPQKSTQQEKDDGGPFKIEMIARMEELPRGERVLPPCDRCRRLHMDCVKNLTACAGCTKKHAKCSWRDVREEEITRMRAGISTSMYNRDKSALTPPRFIGPVAPISAERERRDYEVQHYLSRRESAPSAPNSNISTVPMELPSHRNSPRRAVSETEGQPRAPRPEDVDPDANQRLMQAILDTVDHHTRVAAAVQEKERGAERETGSSAAAPAPAPVPNPNHGPIPYDRGRERGPEREREQIRGHEADRDQDYRLVQA